MSGNTSKPMNTATPPPEDESLFAHIGRSLKNATHKCFGCIQTTDERAKIKYKEYQIDNRKKAFGVEYIGLVRNQATEQTLKECIDTAIKDIQTLEEEIDTLVKEIERVDNVTKEKIVTKPGTTTTAAATTTTASTTPQTATTTTNKPQEAAVVESSSKPTTTTTTTTPAVSTKPIETSPPPKEMTKPSQEVTTTTTEAPPKKEDADMVEVSLQDNNVSSSRDP